MEEFLIADYNDGEKLCERMYFQEILELHILLGDTVFKTTS